MSDVNVNFPPSASPFRAVAAGEVEAMVNGLRAEVEGQLSLADEQVGAVSAQLAETVISTGWNCSALGMVKDDVAEALSNYQILLNAVKAGKKVNVDGKYYIKVDTTMDKTIPGINLTGMPNQNPVLEITSSETLFIIQSAVDIITKDITFNPTTNVTLFDLNSTGYIENFVFDNNICNGNFRCLNARGALSTDPNVVKCGFNKISISNNEVVNSNTDFAKVIDFVYEYGGLENNTIRNFQGSKFFDFYLENTNPFSGAIRQKRKKLLCKGNELINDDTCFLPDTTSFVYYTFLLLEAFSCDYIDNHVEGLKANYNVALYDAYLTVDELNRKGNKYKNNMCFSPAKGKNCELVKAKDGYIRYIEDNTFIIEKEFFTRVGKSPSYVYMFEAEVLSDWHFKNNIFDIYELRLNDTSQKVKSFVFKNNNITGYILSETLLYASFIDGVDYRNSYVEIGSNSFISKDKNSTKYTPSLFRETFPVPVADLNLAVRNSVKLTNNDMMGTAGTINQSFRANEVVITNSNVVGKGFTLFSDLYAIKPLDTSYTTVNNLIFKSDSAVNDKRYPIGIGSKNINYKIIGKPATTGYKRTFHNVFGAYEPTAQKKKIVVEYKVKNTQGIYHFYMDFEYGYDLTNDRMYVKFTQASDSQVVTFLSNKVDGSDAYTTTATNIKLNALSGSAPPIIIRMINPVDFGLATEYSSGLPDEIQEIECWLRTTPIA